MAALYSPRSARGQGSARLAPLFGSNVLRPGTVPNPPAFSQLRALHERLGLTNMAI